MAKLCHVSPDKIVDQSIHSVAKAAGVSVSTVSRMATKLGYSDWKAMRLGIARDMVRMDHLERQVNPVFSGISADDSDLSIVRKILNSSIASLCQTFEWLEEERFLHAVELVNNATRLVFFGSGGSGYVAHDEALRFSHMKMTAEAYSDPYQMLIQASQLKKGQVAFGICNSGRTRITVAALEAARKAGAHTIGISNHRGTPLEAVCDVLLSTAPIHSEFLSASLTPRISVLFIMDALYCLAAHHGNISDSLQDINLLLESNIRIAQKGSRNPRKK